MNAAADPGPPAPVLHVVDGPAAGTRLLVGVELVLGRGTEGPGGLGGDPELSRRHARLTCRSGRLLIEDLGSTNGTRVNGRRIDGPTPLSAGDRVELGTTRIEVRDPAPAPSREPLPPRAEGEPTAPAAREPVPPAGGPPPREPLPPPGGAGLAPPPRPVATPQPAASAAARAHRRRLAATGIAAIVLIAVAVLLALRGGKGSQTTAAGAAETSGTAYIETNVASAGANSVLALRYHDGSFRPLRIAEYPTGGSGSADLNNSGVLDADQQLTVNAAGTLLFAVNQGSDTIAVFHIAADGSLTPVAGSPFPERGSRAGVAGRQRKPAGGRQQGP